MQLARSVEGDTSHEQQRRASPRQGDIEQGKENRRKIKESTRRRAHLRSEWLVIIGTTLGDACEDIVR